MTEEILQQTAIQAIKHIYPEIVINLSLSGINLNGLKPADKSKLFRQLKQQGFRRGMPDVLLYLPEGKVVNLEFKRPEGGVQSEDQKQVEQELKQLGHNYYIVRSVDEVLQAIASNLTTEYKQQNKTRVLNSINEENKLFFPSNLSINAIKQQINQLLGD